MLPGITPLIGGAAEKMELDYLSVRYTSGGGAAVMPTGIVAGDILIATSVAANSNTSYPGLAYGTGFTGIMHSNAADSDSAGKSTYYYRMRTMMSYKIATASDNGASIGGFMNANRERHYVFAVRPSKPVTNINVFDTSAASSSDGSPGNNTLTSGSSSADAVILLTSKGSADTAGTWNGTGWSGVVGEAQISSGVYFTSIIAAYSTPVSNLTVSWSATGFTHANNHIAACIEVT